MTPAAGGAPPDDASDECAVSVNRRGSLVSVGSSARARAMNYHAQRTGGTPAPPSSSHSGGSRRGSSARESRRERRRSRVSGPGRRNSYSAFYSSDDGGRYGDSSSSDDENDYSRIIFCPKNNLGRGSIKAAAALIPSCRVTSRFVRGCSEAVALFGCRQGSVQTVFRQTQPYQFIHRFPRPGDLTSKYTVETQLKYAKRLFPAHYTFVPDSWMFPKDARLLKNVLDRKENADKCYIVKPSSGRGGIGIFLAKNPNAIKRFETRVNRSTIKKTGYCIQEYINNPLLVDRFKFDLRLYVLIMSIDPPEVHVCREGLVRFATDEFKPVTKQNQDNLKMHLTNYTLQKESHNFVHNSDPKKNEGTKRTLSAFVPTLKEMGVDLDELFEKFQAMAEATVRAMGPIVKVLAKDAAHMEICEGRNFHIMGFDVLIDDDLNAHLLEINGRPSLNTQSIHFLSELAKDPELQALNPEEIQELVNKPREPGTAHLAPHVVLTNRVDEHIKSLVVGGAVVRLIERSQQSSWEFDEEESMEPSVRRLFNIYDRCRDNNSVKVFDRMFDYYLEATQGQPFRVFQLRKFFTQYIFNLPRHYRAKVTDIDTAWREHKLEERKMQNIPESLRNFFEFQHLLQVIVEKCTNDLTPHDALMLFLSSRNAKQSKKKKSSHDQELGGDTDYRRQRRQSSSGYYNSV